MPSDPTADLRRRIAKTAASLQQCAAQHAAITEGATARLKQVMARLDELRKTAITDPAAADEYLELTREKGALLRALGGVRREE